MAGSVARVAALAVILVESAAWAAQPKFEPTAVEQAVIERIKAADPQANPPLARNRYCPITGKPVDPAAAPIDCPQKYRHIHLLVGVASAEAAETYRSSEAEDCVTLENTPAKEGRIELALPPRSIVTLYGGAR